MAIVPSGWDTSKEQAMSDETLDKSGEGGGVLDVYSRSIEEIHSTISNSDIAQVTDNSSYGLLGPIIYSSSRAQFDTVSFKQMGYGASGSALDQNTDPLSGSLTFEDTDRGEILGSVSVQGPRYVGSIGPIDRVLKGSNTIGGVGSLKITLAPQIDGIGLSQTGVGGFGVVNFSAQYGLAKGTVFNAEKEPVSSVKIFGEGGNTLSNFRGEYEILVPGGTSVDLTSLGESVTKGVSVASFSETEINWTYAGVYVNVTLPNGEPAVGVPVELDISNDIKETDENGQVKFKEVPIEQSGQFKLFDKITVDLTSGGEGSIISPAEEVGAAFTGKVRHSETRNPIEGVSARVEADGVYASESVGDGTYTAGTVEYGPVTLVVGEDSDLYQTYQKEFGIDEAQIIETNVDLEERSAIGTY